VIRTLHPELLDTLPANHPAAIGSRRDLRRINTLMSHAGIITRALKAIFLNQPPASMVEIGAGEGRLLLRVARRLIGWKKSPGNDHSKIATQFLPLPGGEGRGEGEGRSIKAVASKPQQRSTSPQVDVLFIDLQNLLRDETKAEFAALNWGVHSIEADIFDWLSNPSTKTDVVLANLVLHHFTDAQLTLLFAEAAEKADAFIAVEPRRSRWPLFCSHLLALIGCNAVTCHDAPISVRAGFTGRELSALWPRGGEWELTERPAGLFSHLFIARRKGDRQGESPKTNLCNEAPIHASTGSNCQRAYSSPSPPRSGGEGRGEVVLGEQGAKLLLSCLENLLGNCPK
jgi:hypothetical protein